MRNFHYVYLLQSLSPPQQIYTGRTDDLKQRLAELILDHRWPDLAVPEDGHTPGTLRRAYQREDASSPFKSGDLSPHSISSADDSSGQQAAKTGRMPVPLSRPFRDVNYVAVAEPEIAGVRRHRHRWVHRPPARTH